MADTKTSALTASGGLADGDLMMFVDVSDTTMAASGTNKKVPLSDVRNQLLGTFYVFAANNFR